MTGPAQITIAATRYSRNATRPRAQPGSPRPHAVSRSRRLSLASSITTAASVPGSCAATSGGIVIGRRGYQQVSPRDPCQSPSSFLVTVEAPTDTPRVPMPDQSRADVTARPRGRSLGLLAALLVVVVIAIACTGGSAPTTSPSPTFNAVAAA